MLLAAANTIDDAIELLSGQAVASDEGELVDGDAAQLLDLIELLREDVRLGAASLDRELRRLAGDAAKLEQGILSLEEAGHAMAVHAAAQAAALPKLGLLRRLLDAHARDQHAPDQHSGAGRAATGSAASQKVDTCRTEVEAASAFDAAVVGGLDELADAFAPDDGHTAALARVIEVGSACRLAPGGLEAGIAACRQRLQRFESRLLLALRQPGAAERRRDPRLPVRLAATLRCGTRQWQGTTVDLAKGGALVAVALSFDRPPIGGSARLELAELGQFSTRIVGLSAKGAHLAFDRLTGEQELALETCLAAVANIDAPFVNLARWAACEVEACLARGVAGGALAAEALFASPALLQALPAAPTDELAGRPGQGPGEDAEVRRAAAALAFLQEHLPPLQTQIAASRGEIVYAACTDRHGFLTAVTRGPAAGSVIAASADGVPAILGLDGAVDESDSGLAAARSRQPQRVTSPVPGIREVVLPVTAAGRHWGAFRLGFAESSPADTDRSPGTRSSPDSRAR